MTKEKRISLDETYMRVAEEWAKRSYARRKKVGAVVVNVKQHRCIAEGYNGTPAGFDNNCENEPSDSNIPVSELTTNSYVLHAELNSLMKMARSTDSTDGCTMYVTMSPCMECSKMMIQAGIKRVVYREKYRIDDGVELLRKAGVIVEHLP